jgi:hypothetical protein
MAPLTLCELNLYCGCFWYFFSPLYITCKIQHLRNNFQDCSLSASILDTILDSILDILFCFIYFFCSFGELA